MSASGPVTRLAGQASALGAVQSQARPMRDPEANQDQATEALKEGLAGAAAAAVNVSTVYKGYKHRCLGVKIGPRVELWPFWGDLRPGD
eukprot:1148996-Pelagomonas_calceolata.AAC.1